ncbi:MAG: TonB-dependent receptor [Acidobacteriota bacterium]
MTSLFVRLSLPLLLLFAASPGWAASISGRVASTQGSALEHVEVSVVQEDRSVFTGPQGEFEIADCQLPCLLLVRHPRFVEQVLELTEAPAAALVVEMEAKQAVFERIDVTAAGGGGAASFAPLSVASTEIRVDEKAAPPTTLTELVEGVAGVAENGQPGLFQVYAIRGVSRHRVLTLIDGMQITGERRAGVATSFVDPLLMGAVDVLRGPASTYYGSGALGGVVQVFPKVFDGFELHTGWMGFADENYQAVGWGEDGWSLGFVRRDASDDEVADGSPQNTHFTQYSASLLKTWQRGDKTYEVLLMPSLGDDIGKPNTDFPDDRITNYPEEQHLLMKLGVRSDKGWSFHAYAHPNTLETEVLRPGSRINVIDNEAFDLGAHWQKEWSFGRSTTGRYGVDYFGRRGVSADEFERRFESGETSLLETLDGAEQDELAAFGSVRWSLGAATLQAGGRATWHQQSNSGFGSQDDSAFTAFLGLVRPVGAGIELVANVGTGLRFPTLSERFFSGTTGRGGVIGNPNLDPEESTNLDVGLRWFGKRTYVAVQVFQLDVDDYIERIEIEPDLLTFVNLVSGTIEGFEIEGFHQLNDTWRLTWSGHILDGEDDDGGPLADISADRLQLGLRYDGERWGGNLQWQLRDAKDDPGSGEVALESANVVSASLSYEVSPGLDLVLRGRNLLDEVYLSSADDKSSAAPGRSVGLGLTWNR